METGTEQKQALQDLVSVRDFVRWGATRFTQATLHFGHGTDNAFDEALALVCHALFLPPVLPDGYIDCRLTMDEKLAIAELFNERIGTRKPAAYIIGKSWFAGMPFYVDERVLIPRSPLAEPIMQGFAPWLESESVERILDLCTGSGCIGIACAHAFENASVHVADLSSDALEVARKNIQLHELDDWVTPIQSDLFENLSGYRYQMIISNPPYVPDEEMQTLPGEFGHEPELGLKADDEGLEIVIRILEQASDYLDDDGILVVEVGNSQEALEERFPEVPFVWLEFEHGGHGVFLLEAQQVKLNRAIFASQLSSGDS